MSDLADRLEEKRQTQEWVRTWKPDCGEILVGTFEKLDAGTTPYGKYPIAHIRDENGELWGVWLYHAVLQAQWEETGPQLGDRVGILYNGKRAGPDHDYHHYDVEVERRATAFDNDRPSKESENGHRASDLNASDLDSATSGGDATLEDPNGDLPY